MRKTTLVAGACAAAFFAVAIPVLAQIAPGDSGAGVRRGLEDIGITGQAGTVTLFNASAGSGTLVVINLQGQPSNRIESASIQRGKTCHDIEPNPVWMLNDVHNGHSATVVPADESKLLSGNYVVIVHAGQLPASAIYGNSHNHNAMHGKNMSAMKSMNMSNGNIMINGTMVSQSRWKPALCGQLYAGT